MHSIQYPLSKVRTSTRNHPLHISKFNHELKICIISTHSWIKNN